MELKACLQVTSEQATKVKQSEDLSKQLEETRANAQAINTMMERFTSLLSATAGYAVVSTQPVIAVDKPEQRQTVNLVTVAMQTKDVLFSAQACRKVSAPDTSRMGGRPLSPKQQPHFLVDESDSEVISDLAMLSPRRLAKT